MDEVTLQRDIISKAKLAGICSEGEGILTSAGNKQAMVDYYLTCPDWCLEREFPSYDTLVNQFSDCQSQGVYIGERFDKQIMFDKQVYVFHNCKGVIYTGLNTDKAIIPMIYVANSCDLKIIGLDMDFADEIYVPVYSYGKNKLNLKKSQATKFKLYQNSLLK